MKLNNINIRIALNSSENLDEEMVLYNEEASKIIVLNRSAAYVWKKIIEFVEEKTDFRSENIVDKLLSYYELSKESFNEVLIDVNETIELLFEAGLIVKV